MLRKKHRKIVIIAVLALCVISIYVSNQAIKRAVPTDVNWDDTHTHRLSGKIETTHLKKTSSENIDSGCDRTVPSVMWSEIITGSVYILSTFYDNRGNRPYVRMISAVLSDSSKPDLWCHFGSKNNFVSTKVLFEEMSENHVLPYGGWILSCEVPETWTPSCKISLSTSETYQFAKAKMINLTIIPRNSFLRDKHQKQLKFAVCIPPVFGSFPARRLVEFFEMVHYLGADKIFTYVLTKDLAIRRILQYYERKQYVELLPWHLPFGDVATKNLTSKSGGTYTIRISSIWYNGQLLAANDCLYRTMQNFELTLFSDLDEILVPKADSDKWDDVINKIRSENASGYSFKSAYFQRDYESDITLFASNRTLQFSPKRNKVMVHPERVLEVGIHHVSRSLSNVRKYTTFHVPDNVAFIHLYRTCQKERNLNCSIQTVDNTMVQKYKLILTQAVTKALADIKLFQDGEL